MVILRSPSILVVNSWWSLRWLWQQGKRVLFGKETRRQGGGHFDGKREIAR
jgi:hypothetical protein